MSGVEIQPGDYAEWDWENVELAGAHFFGEMHDLMFHAFNPGEGWTPFAKAGDVPALIVETRAHLDRIEAAIKNARAEIAGVERNARLAARRRQRAEKKAEENR